MNGFSSFDVQTSIDYWSGCPGYGPYIPPFEFGGSTVMATNSGSSAGPGRRSITESWGPSRPGTSSSWWCL